MKYSLQLDLDLPRERVLELFDNPDNMKEWQPGLVSYEHLGGEPGQVGATAKLVYKMGKRDVEMIETVTHRNLPDEFFGSYEAKGVYNYIENRFTELDANTTRWDFYTEFKMTGFMKVMGWIMPGSFKKQSFKFMKLFKEFAEKAE